MLASHQGSERELQSSGETLDIAHSLQEEGTNMDTVLDSIALVATGALWGGMVFFAFVYAPLIFIKLEADTAGRFIRQVFPVYYLAMGIASGVSATALALGTTHGQSDITALACVCAGFWVARQWLMPAINRTRDAHLSGGANASVRFKRLHGLSVLINTVQLVAVLVVLVRFGWQ